MYIYTVVILVNGVWLGQDDRSISQSIFYFMSVHIEVILDKNKNI